MRAGRRTELHPSARVCHEPLKHSSLQATAGQLSAAAQVVLGRWKCALVAIKVLREECMQHASSAALADFRREAELLQSMRHPFILNFLGACFDCKPVRTQWCILVM